MFLRPLLVIAIIGEVLAQQAAPPPTPLVERVGDTGFLQLEANSFAKLDARQQALAYWLTQASIAIDPIIYDQLSRFGLREKRLLEEIMGHTAGIPAEPLGKIRQYALLFWANRGNHNENTSQKFLPAFTFGLAKGASDYPTVVIGIGAWLGTIMLLNVWGIIWPNQKKILGIKPATDEEKAKARKAALYASRTNFILSIPMLLCMAATSHGLPI